MTSQSIFKNVVKDIHKKLIQVKDDNTIIGTQTKKQIADDLLVECYHHTIDWMPSFDQEPHEPIAIKKIDSRVVIYNDGTIQLNRSAEFNNCIVVVCFDEGIEKISDIDLDNCEKVIMSVNNAIRPSLELIKNRVGVNQFVIIFNDGQTIEIRELSV